MIKTEMIQLIKYRDIVNKFGELTGWADASRGAWNADLSKPAIFTAELGERTFHHEQDWFGEYYPSNFEKEVTADVSSVVALSETGAYAGRVIYQIPLEAIMQWLVVRGEIVDNGTIIVNGW
jgi:hypothetical protein